MTQGELSAELVASYRQRGFVRIPGILDPDEVAIYREAVERFRERTTTRRGGEVFAQYVDAWRQDDTLASLTRHPRLAAAAEALAGIPLRLWHDHILVKDPHNNAPTEFHQDMPYWPHANCRHALSAWVALVDVPVERGCMTFVTGSQDWQDLPPQNLRDHESLARLRPEIRWRERVTLPLRAGDCTFHNAYTAHSATPNDTDEARLAHVIIYMDVAATYTGKGHPVTDPLHLTVGQPYPDDRFPRDLSEEPLLSR